MRIIMNYRIQNIDNNNENIDNNNENLKELELQIQEINNKILELEQQREILFHKINIYKNSSNNLV